MAAKKAVKSGILGIDIGGSGIKGAVVDVARGEMISERFRVPTPRPALPDRVALVVVVGVARLAAAFSAGSFGRGALAFVGGALTTLAGFIMVARPETGVAALTLMLDAYLLVDGIFGAILAFQVRPEKGWGWMLFGAAMSVVLGFLLLKEWPADGSLGRRDAGGNQSPVRGIRHDLDRLRRAQADQGCVLSIVHARRTPCIATR